MHPGRHRQDILYLNEMSLHKPQESSQFGYVAHFYLLSLFSSFDNFVHPSLILKVVHATTAPPTAVP